ncbi:MFS transporter [Reichenbachiella sp. MALMAid0571]|uniref:MFS transporter n=1 Tax=Reichenbachiella sp. MALMAid0571 TaxID=3143939 RepID=UPI0032DEDB9E
MPQIEKHKSEFILLSLWLLMFSSSSQFLIISPILSQIGEQLSIPDALRGTLITAYALTLGIVALLTGPISDRIGRRKVLLIGSGVLAVSLALHQLAFDYTSILIMRILSGFGGGVLTGSCVAYIGDYFPKERRGWANGVIATGSAAGQILGIPVGTIVSEMFGFYAPFQFFAVIMFISFFMILFWVPQPKVELANCSIKIGDIVKDYFSILKIKSVKTIALGYLLMFLSVTVFIVYFPTWLENEYNASSVDIALLFFIGGLATIFSGPLAGKISDRSGRKSIIIISNLLLGLIMSISIFFLDFGIEFSYPVFFIIMLLAVGRMIPFQALASEMIDDKSRGRMMALVISVGQIGMAIGSAISGYVYTEFGFFGNAIIGAIASVVMAVLINKYISEPKMVLKNESV